MLMVHDGWQTAVGRTAVQIHISPGRCVKSFLCTSSPITRVDGACDTTQDVVGPGKSRGVMHAAEHRAHRGSSPVLVNHGPADDRQACLLQALRSRPCCAQQASLVLRLLVRAKSCRRCWCSRGALRQCASTAMGPGGPADGRWALHHADMQPEEGGDRARTETRWDVIASLLRCAACDQALRMTYQHDLRPQHPANPSSRRRRLFDRPLPCACRRTPRLDPRWRDAAADGWHPSCGPCLPGASMLEVDTVMIIYTAVGSGGPHDVPLLMV